MTLFFEWEHLAADGAHTGGGNRQIHRRQPGAERVHQTVLIVSGSIGLVFGQAAGARESASLAQNRVPSSSPRALSQHRAPAAPRQH